MNAATSPPADPGSTSRAGTAAELTASNIEAVLKLEREAKSGRTASQRIAQSVAAFCGTMTFVWLHVLWFSIWIGLNVVPGGPQFDKFTFTFLTLTVSLEAIFLSAFILISQNEETRIEVPVAFRLPSGRSYAAFGC